MQKHFQKILCLFIGLFILGACSNRLQLPDSKSGFLKDYHLFKPNPHNDNSWVRTKRNFSVEDLAQYQKVAIAPIELWLDPNKPIQIKDKSKQRRLTAYFEEQIQAKFKDKLTIVPPGTKDSLLVRIAITNLEENTPELEVLDILPFRIAMNVGESAYRLAAKKKAIIGKASLEAEFVDTNSGKGLVAVIVNNNSDEMNVDDDPTNIDSIKVIIDGWVNKLINALEGGK